MLKKKSQKEFSSRITDLPLILIIFSLFLFMAYFSDTMDSNTASIYVFVHYALLVFALSYFDVRGLLSMGSRILFLFIAALLGWISFSRSDVFLEALIKGEIPEFIGYLILVFPTLAVLWVFRSHDAREQLEANKNNTDNNTFFECAKMLTEEHLEGKASSKKIALEQLAYLKRETGFDEKRIDALTKGCNLEKENLNRAYLGGIDLSMAKLNNTQLMRADLSNTNLFYSDLINTSLFYANLSNANLMYAKLTNADLRYTNLSDIAYNDETEWQGATYNDKTNFGKTKFKDKKARDDAGMIYESNEQK